MGEYNKKDPALAPFSAVLLPCPPVEDSMESWTHWARHGLPSSYHYFGTAAIGPVVEPGTFAVKGIQGLHIADASIFPIATNVNPQATILAVGQFIGTKLIKHYQL